jgi:hypothetical protein
MVGEGITGFLMLAEDNRGMEVDLRHWDLGSTAVASSVQYGVFKIIGWC